MDKWARSNYQPNLPLKDGKYVTASAEHIALSLAAAEEGMVLLKNRDSLLPLTPGIKLCLFGKATFDYVKGGGGSGDVHTRYIRNLYEGIKLNNDAEIFEPLADFYRENTARQYRQGAVPGMTVEPELPDALLQQAKAFSDTALISISRFSGESWDRSSVEYIEEDSPYPPEGKSMPQIAGEIFPDGDFYLTAAEKAMIRQVTASFKKVIVVLNTGGVIDTRWIRHDDSVGAALLAWQGGMEGGLAAANILFGRVTPSGKLPDTFACTLEDYPSSANFHESFHYVDYTEDIYVGYRYFHTIAGAEEKICYPFGYGLSYTAFATDVQTVHPENDSIHVLATVRNTGNYPGKEVVQLYCTAPQGKLGKPAYTLVCFSKTELLQPGQEQVLTLSFPLYAMASYDDSGLIQKSAYVLERGSYSFHIGGGLHDLKTIDYTLELESDKILQQLSEKLAPTSLSRRLRADGSFESLTLSPAHNPNEDALPRMADGETEGLSPAAVGYPRRFRGRPYADGVHPLLDVAEGRLTLDAFIAQLSDDDLIHLLGGQPNTSVANTYGFGNLSAYGIPNIMTADGPAGVRIEPCTGVRTTAFPCGTLLASTWNPDIVRQVGEAGGAEVKENNLAVWLTPAVNIHRNPYCGRNFEYYSEDPLLAGTIGAAMVQGIQSNNVAACVKHFACNNKETNRKNSDSRLSERALREIYLKVFEIIVKTADPWSLMTSYNIINGHRASESHELLEDILRGEWGFRGCITTDWWNRSEHYKEVLAGNDVKMGTGFPERLKTALEKNLITRADLEICAKRVLELILKID